MSVMWMVTDKQCKHFIKCTVIEDFKGDDDVVYTTSGLKRFVNYTKDSETINLVNLLRQ